MNPPRTARVALVLWLALSGCADGCDCGAGGDGGSDTPRPAERVAAPRTEAAPEPTATDAGAPRPAATRGFVPLEAGELRARVEKLSQGVAWERKLGKPTSVEKLRSLLSDRVGDYKAAGPASVDEREAGEVHVVIASRQYEHDESSLYIKVSDTASAVPLRTGFREQLLVVADEAGGNQRVEIIEGSLALVAYHPQERVSRAALLVRERYLVELIARGTDEKDAAKGALAAIRVESLK